MRLTEAEFEFSLELEIIVEFEPEYRMRIVKFDYFENFTSYYPTRQWTRFLNTVWARVWTRVLKTDEPELEDGL